VTLQDLGNAGEFIAAIATVITLIYLAVQIRQNTQSVQRSAETALSHHVAAWSGEVVRNPELGRIWDAAATEPESLTDDEKRQYLWYVAQLFELYEGQFHLYLDGNIPERSWDSKAVFMATLLKLPLVSAWWESGLAPLSSDFVAYVNELRLSPRDFPVHKGVLRDMAKVPPSKTTKIDT